MAKDFRAHLTSLHTAFGTRSVYDSICFCNRCGMCASVCPSYQQTQQEPFSPRGRNQACRQVLTGKVKKNKQEQQLLQEILLSCDLCGRCLQACPGQIPTAQHMLELRRRLGISLLPRSVSYLLRLWQSKPRVVEKLGKIFCLVRRSEIIRGFGWIFKLNWISHLLDICPASTSAPVIQAVEDPTLIYLPSFEAQVIMPWLFAQTYKLAIQQHHTLVWQHTASGLFEYVYGDVRQARRQVHQLILRHARTAKGQLPILTDSIDVYNFLVQVPQLFDSFPSFKRKATNFAKHVCFITDLLPDKPKLVVSFPGSIQLMPSALFSQQTKPISAAHQILHTLFKKNFVQCEYKDVNVSPCGYGFVKHTRAPDYALAAVQTVATHQTQTVFVLSGLAALELAFYLRKFYPTAHVRHIIELTG